MFSTEAILALLDSQMPPEFGKRLVVEPTHTSGVPLAETKGIGFTVIFSDIA